MKGKTGIKILGLHEDVFISFAAQNGIKIYSSNGDLFVAPTKAPKLLSIIQKNSVDCEITFCGKTDTSSQKPQKRQRDHYKNQE